MHTDHSRGCITEDSASFQDLIGDFKFSVPKTSPLKPWFIVVRNYELPRFQLIILYQCFDLFILPLPCSRFWVSFLLPILTSWTLGNIDIVDSHLLSRISHPTLPSNPLDCGETSIPKFKIPLQKELLYMGAVLVILIGDRSFHRQGIRSDVYALVIIKNGKVSCLLIANGDMHLVRELENRCIPGHGEGSLFVNRLIIPLALTLIYRETYSISANTVVVTPSK